MTTETNDPGAAQAPPVLEVYPPSAALVAWAEGARVRSLPQLFRESAARLPDRPWVGACTGDSYHYLTYAEGQKQVEAFASALISLGIRKGDRVSVFSPNRREWAVTDLGTLHAAAVVVPLYPSLAAGEAQYILADAGARIVVVATRDHLERVLSVSERLPYLQHIVSMDPLPEGVAPPPGKRLWNFTEFLENDPGHADEVRQRIESLQPVDIATIVYTSGTTGFPKGAMLTHGNIVSNVEGVKLRINPVETDVEYSFLPLAHLFERCVYFSITAVSGAVAFVEDIKSYLRNIAIARPTIVPNVPRGYEVIFQKVLGSAPQSGVKKKIFDWSMKVGHDQVAAEQEGHVSMWQGLKSNIAHKLVLDRVAEGIDVKTGGRVRLFASGGAPLRREVAELFLASDFPMVEGYGLTETSPIISINDVEHPRLGTVGKILDGVEVKIADTGEICVRGPNVMNGYLNKPEATREAIDAEGWFHTGDIGSVHDGYLSITGRIKDLLVLSNGKKVAPQPIEDSLQASPFIAQVVLVGDNLPAVGALVIPHFDALAHWAEQSGLPSDPQALIGDARVKALLTGEIDRICAPLSEYEKVKHVAVLEHPLSEAAGELTPTLKVKRGVVKTKYKAQIDAMYR